MNLVLYTYMFLLGLMLGSFFNVVGLRVPEKKSIIKPRSHCTKCKHVLSALELIPVISYVLQKGRCKSCGTKISLIYPAIELLTGILFLLSTKLLGWTPELFIALVFISLLMIIFVSDIHYMIIPDKVLLFFAPLLLIGRLLIPLTPWWSAIIGSVVGFSLLLFISYISKGGLGGGDIKLFAVLGLPLGLKGILLALILSSLYGSIIGLIGIMLGKINRGQPIPFGPFIVFGAITAYFFGQHIVEWYVEFILV